ncbi:MAG TPA: RHS repeat-associated core domain-containing protein [Acidimicrobiales bacterium]|nr:RHS repeat-associated core domain-containing protein [Acidimicrobiales bacterium]
METAPVDLSYSGPYWSDVSLLLGPSSAREQVSLVGSTTVSAGGGAGSLTLSTPGGVIAGDELVAILGAAGVGCCSYSPIEAPDSSWTPVELSGTPASGEPMWVFTKVAGDDEPSSYTFTGDSSVADMGGTLLAFSGTSGLDGAPAIFGATTDTATLPALSASQPDDVWVVASYSNWAKAYMDTPSGMTELGSSDYGSYSSSDSDSFWAYDEALGTAMETAPVDLSYSGPYWSDVSLLLGPGQLSAQDVTPLGKPVTTDAYGGSDLSAQCRCYIPVIKKPYGIAPGDGDLVESSTDISVPGAGFPLELTRTYDSGLAQQQVNASSSPGPLGYGWSYNLGMNLVYDSSTGAATVDQEDGSEIGFSPYASSSSPSWCTGSQDYCADAPRDLATLEQNSDGSWTFVRYSGGEETTFEFSSAGALTTETDQTGQSLDATAGSPGSGQCPSAASSCTVWTSSASGRSLTLAFDSSGRLLAATDDAGNSVSYCYFGQSCAAGAANGGAEDLYSVTAPGGATTTYGYDSSNSTTAYDHDILSEDLPSGGTVTNTFNSSGQVASQDAPSGDVTLSYSGDNQAVSGGSTIVSTWPAGTSGSVAPEVVDYQFSSGALVAETTGYGTPAASTQYLDLDPTSLVPTTVQDGDGDQSSSTLVGGTSGDPEQAGDVTVSTDAIGNTTLYAYNDANQVWCEVSPGESLDGVTCPSSAPSSPPSPGASDPELGAAINYYGSAGELTAETDPLGNTTTYSYTSGVSGVPDGLAYCSVDPVDYQNDVTCPAYGATHVTGTTTATFDSAGDVTSTTDADGATTTYYYAASGHPGLVSSETSPDGTTTSYTYDSAGQVVSETESSGSYSATTLYAYDAAGDRYCEVAPDEVADGVTCPSSSPSSPPTPGSDPYLGATITTYNSAGQAVQVTNPLGGISYTAYDDAGNAYCTVAPTEAADGVTCPSSPPTSSPTPGSDPYLGATITTYDSSGQVAQVTNPLGGITLSEYDADGNLTETTVESDDSSTDPDVVTSYAYDADDRVTSTTVDPGGSQAATTLQSYDPDGNVYCSVSANAYATGGYQCPPWQASWAAAPPSPSSLYSSTPSTSQADDVTTTFYDADGNELQSTGPDVQTSISAYDGDGRQYCSADATNVATWLAAHSSGSYPYLCPSSPRTTAPSSGSDPGYTTTIYDAEGQALSTTDPLGDTTSYTYSPGGSVLTTTNPLGNVTTNCYYYEDTSGQCAAGAPSGGGSADDLYSTTTPDTSADPSGETTYYTYFPGGEADTTATPAGVTTDAYDANGDLTSVSYSGTASGYSTPAEVTRTYNVDGSTATMTDATGTTTYGYDADGDLTSVSLVAGSGTGLSDKAVSYSYFSTGDLASLTYPAYSGSSDPVVGYSYDPTGVMASATDWEGDEVTFAHDSDGNLTAQDNAVSSSDPDGTSSTAFSYDAADEMTGATSALAQTCGGAESLTQAFSGSGGSRNADGQLTEYSASYSGSCSGEGPEGAYYSYDRAGRVVYQGTAAQGSSADNFAYDSAGDPTTISEHDSSGDFDTYTQSFDDNGEVTAQAPVSGSGGSSSSYTYDTLGDQATVLTSTATTTYGYDQVGQLSSFTPPSASGTTYLYDGDGLEAASTTASTTTQYTWDVSGSLPLLLSDGSYDYVYGPGTTPVEQVALSTSTPTYLSYDQTDGTWLSTNAAGEETGFWGYDAFGTLSFGTPTSGFGYAGQYTDASTGLSDMRARWYEAGSGEFTSVDPDLAETDQPYAYAGDDPVNSSDPSGLATAATNGWLYGAVPTPCGIIPTGPGSVPDAQAIWSACAIAYHTTNRAFLTQMLSTIEEQASSYVYGADQAYIASVYQHDPAYACSLERQLQMSPREQGYLYIMAGTGLMFLGPGSGEMDVGPSAPEGGSLDGATNYQVNDPADPGRTITDIDRIEDGTLWEEKSATNAPDPEQWIQKQVVNKFYSYLDARQYLPGYENAPIGFDFTSSGADPAFQAQVDQAIENLRAANPGVTIKLQWAP